MNRGRLAEQTTSGLRLIRQLVSERDHLTLYRVGTRAEEFFDNSPPDSRRDLLQVLRAGLGDEPQAGPTEPGHFWTAVGSRVAQSSTPTEIVLFTDGEDDERSDRRRCLISGAVKQLADNPRVLRVTICGVTPENRAHLRSTFAKLGERFEIRGPEGLRSLSLAPLPRGEQR